MAETIPSLGTARDARQAAAQQVLDAVREWWDSTVNDREVPQSLIDGVFDAAEEYGAACEAFDDWCRGANWPVLSVQVKLQ